MGEIINLRSYRKKKRRDERQDTAAQNRVRNGRSKGQREREKKEAETTVASLEEHRLEKDGDEGVS